MNEPKVTVIIPVYNVERYVKGSVKSVLDQTYQNIDIIIVDDGSSDKSSQICDAFAMEYKQITVIHKRNGGLSSARNAGLDYIYNTDYVLFLDSDDQLVKSAIEDMVRMAQCSGADMIIPNQYIRLEEKTGNRKITYHFPKELHREDPTSFALDVIIENGRAWRATALLYSYHTIAEAGARFPEGHIAEDISFNLQILYKAKKIEIYQQPTLVCLKRDNSISSSFQKNFEKDIWYIDQQARFFLERVGMDNETGRQKVDSLLCRNIVMYLFSILSHNNCMKIRDKVFRAKSLLNAPESRQSVRRRHQTPYFEDKNKMRMLALVYWMLRHKMDYIVFFGVLLL